MGEAQTTRSVGLKRRAPTADRPSKKFEVHESRGLANSEEPLRSRLWRPPKNHAYYHSEIDLCSRPRSPV